MFVPDLLAGRRIALADTDHSLQAALNELGADTHALPSADGEEELAAWVSERVPLDGLVFDARPGFGGGGLPALNASLERTWVAARAVATGALIPARAGRLIFVAPAPAPGTGPHAEAARAGLENLARTLSVEWARFTVTAVAVHPGTATTEDDLARLISFLLSPAGGYLTGCRFELGAATPSTAVPA